MIDAKVKLDLTPGEQLAKSGLRRATRIGLSRAASPVKGSVVSHANSVRRFGFLAKSIRIRLRIYPSERYVAVVGPSMNFIRTKGKYKRGKHKGQPRRHRPAYYAHLVERGTKRSRARPWLAPAHAESASGFIENARREVGAEITRELDRQRAREGGRT